MNIDIIRMNKEYMKITNKMTNNQKKGIVNLLDGLFPNEDVSKYLPGVKIMEIGTSGWEENKDKNNKKCNELLSQKLIKRESDGMLIRLLFLYKLCGGTNDENVEKIFAEVVKRGHTFGVPK